MLSQPDPSDCCNSGCNPCILDVYNEKLKKPQPNLKPNENCIQQTSYSIFKLIKRDKHTETTILLEYAYIRSKTGKVCQFNLNFKPGQYFLLKFNECTRAYTPIFCKAQQFTILVRLYNNGKMSNYLKGLEVGEETLWRGPYGDFCLDTNVRHLVCIGQGVGLAPLFAIISHLLQDDNCEQFIKLLYCCRNSQDILLRDFLYNFTLHWNFTYEVFLSDCSAIQRKYNETVNDFRLDLGYLNSLFGGNLRESPKLVLISGTDLFINVIKGHLTQIGLTNNELFSF